MVLHRTASQQVELDVLVVVVVDVIMHARFQLSGLSRWKYSAFRVAKKLSITGDDDCDFGG